MDADLTKQAKDAIPPINAAIDALNDYWQKGGQKKPLHPDDPEVDRLFKQLWSVSFDKHYSPELQAEIIKQMKKDHPVKLRTMWRVGNAAEFELERSHAGKVLKEAEALPNAKPLAALDAIQAFKKLCASFPYDTFHTLDQGEQALASAAGMGFDEKYKGVHLIIEAEPLPLSAIYSSLNRDGGRVLATISDPKNFEAASRVISTLERIGILEPGKVKLVNKDATPRTVHELKELEKPYMATITQLVLGSRDIALLIKGCNEAGIDTVIARGAHGLVEMLYESLDGISVSVGTFRPKLTAIPKPVENGEHSQSCYNSSHLYTSRFIGHPAETPNHSFRDEQQQQRKRA